MVIWFPDALYLSGILSFLLLYTLHHKVSYDNLPTFDCQEGNPECLLRISFPSAALSCPPPLQLPENDFKIKHYFNEEVEFHYFSSMYTIKSKLKKPII